MAQVQIFLSTVSAEFRSYRDVLRRALTRPNVSVFVQEDFIVIVTGTETLDMLDDYIRQCDAVIHLVGDMTGALAQAPSLTLIRGRYPSLGEKLPRLAPFLQPGAPLLSYTQWEAWLALYHGKRLFIAVPEDSAPRDESYELIPEQRAAQQKHLKRLSRKVDIPFANVWQLALEVLRSSLFDICLAAGLARRVTHIPYPSIRDLFKGRGETLKEVHSSLINAPAMGAAIVVATALHGLGGVGKTRLAVEYARHHADDYTAVLFVGADSPEALKRNLAELCSPTILALPEHAETEVTVQFAAVMRWLQHNPGWLLILDNVDSNAAAQAAEGLLPDLSRGHVLITSRLSNWSGSVVALPLGVLDTPAAVDFLLARTDTRRRKHADDTEHARSLAVELGGLALALEQAGAYIAQHRLSLTGYLAQWRVERDKVLAWYDPRLMQYPTSVAVTWQASFDQLGESTRLLLQRLAWLAPDPIPESLLNVPVPSAAVQDDARAALAELEAYSLATRAEDELTFVVHRLVQEVTRCVANVMPLNDALGWIDAAFAGDAQDVRSWPVLRPLLPHVRAIVSHADAAAIADPTARLMNQAGDLLHGMALYDQAQPLCERALEIREQVLGPEHLDVAMSLSSLVELLYSLGAYEQAESLAARAVAIREKALGHKHPDVAQSLAALAKLYRRRDRCPEAEALYLRALKIREDALGREHPDVAHTLNNLAVLYRTLRRYNEAEPLYVRALDIAKRAFGPNHPNVGKGLNNLAACYREQRAFEQAERLFLRALQIQENAFGLDHPQVAYTLNNLAMLYRDQRAYEEAQPRFMRALTILNVRLGPDHPDTKTVTANYDVLLRAMG